MTEVTWVRNLRAQTATKLKIVWPPVMGAVNSGGTVDQLYETMAAALHHTIQMYVPMRNSVNVGKIALPIS